VQSCIGHATGAAKQLLRRDSIRSIRHDHVCEACGDHWEHVQKDCERISAASCPEHQSEPDIQISSQKSLFRLLTTVSTLLVILGLLRLPYSFYTLLRVSLCATAAVGFLRARIIQRRLWLVGFGAMAVLYNPVLPIHLGTKAAWIVINVLTILLFWCAASLWD